MVFQLKRLHLKVPLKLFSILHITQTNNQWTSADTVCHLDIKYLKLSHRFVEEETTRCQIKNKLKFFILLYSEIKNFVVFDDLKWT